MNKRKITNQDATKNINKRIENDELEDMTQLENARQWRYNIEEMNFNPKLAIDVHVRNLILWAKEEFNIDLKVTVRSVARPLKRPA